jgi:hypothetical protein
MRGRALDVAVGLLLLVLTTVGLQLASRTQGFTRDEGYYFTAAENHIAYYEEALTALRAGRFKEPFSPRFIDRYFGYNSEHPPLMKTLFGLSWRLLHRCSCPSESGLHPLSYPHRHRTLGLLKQGDAMRLPTQLLAGLLVAAVYLFAARCWGRTAGLGAAGLAILLPRHVFHAQLACFDAPVAAMIFLITWAYLRAQQSGSRRWAVAAGVLLGLGLATKHNTFFLPLVLLGHSLWVRRGRLRGLRSLPGLFAKVLAVGRYVAAPWAVAMAVLGPLVYLLLWPYLWGAPVQRFGSYLGFHLHHVHYNIEYLGQNYNKPPYPWHYVPVMTLLTTPVTTLVLFAVGSFALLRRSVARPAAPAGETDAAPGLLVALSVLWPILVIMRPGTPIFGAEKHWLPAMPFLALLGGVGLAVVVARLAAAFPLAARLRPVLSAALLLVALGPPLLEVRRSHPYALSHYNLLAGGPTGGATLGMNRQFWGYAVRGVFPWLNAQAAPGAPIYFHDANWNQLQMSQKDGLLRRDLYDSGLEEPGVRASDIALVIHEKHFNKYEYWIWDAFGTTRPSFVLTHEGVPIVTVYERPGRPRPAGEPR